EMPSIIPMPVSILLLLSSALAFVAPPTISHIVHVPSGLCLDVGIVDGISSPFLNNCNNFLRAPSQFFDPQLFGSSIGDPTRCLHAADLSNPLGTQGFKLGLLYDAAPQCQKSKIPSNPRTFWAKTQASDGLSQVFLNQDGATFCLTVQLKEDPITGFFGQKPEAGNFIILDECNPAKDTMKLQQFVKLDETMTQ
ncbi:hypothetical protein HDU91_005430, partial [Kappamyces sp. JEL0680]